MEWRFCLHFYIVHLTNLVRRQMIFNSVVIKKSWFRPCLGLLIFVGLEVCGGVVWGAVGAPQLIWNYWSQGCFIASHLCDQSAPAFNSTRRSISQLNQLFSFTRTPIVADAQNSHHHIRFIAPVLFNHFFSVSSHEWICCTTQKRFCKDEKRKFCLQSNFDHEDQFIKGSVVEINWQQIMRWDNLKSIERHQEAAAAAAGAEFQSVMTSGWLGPRLPATCWPLLTQLEWKRKLNTMRERKKNARNTHEIKI